MAETFDTLDPKTISDWNCEFTNYKGDSGELSGIIKQLSIWESIYNNCMMGNIMIDDGTGMVEANGIVGSGLEEFHFEILTPNTASPKTSNLEKEFKIDSISTGLKNPKSTFFYYNRYITGYFLYAILGEIEFTRVYYDFGKRIEIFPQYKELIYSYKTKTFK